uniref:Uncharacterized protein n=1 Tax=Salix viminalis TaxID=40686 RepID=A0A6N2MFD1_SALVM
MIFYCITMSPL